MALPNKVNIGTAAGNGTGDPARTAFDKLNKRDEYLDTNKADKSEITALQTDIDSKETPAGSQAKADAAEAAANSYTDSLLQGRKWKDAADVATTGNITLSGEQTIDGVLTSASRVLVKNQTNKAENGIYTTDAGPWTRTADADSGAELEAATLKVLGGTENLNKIFTCNSTSITIGTTDVVFAFIGEGTDHNSTTGIQGGQAGEYYHLTQAERDKLTGIEAGATGDQTGAEIKALYEAQPNTNALTDARRDKLDGIPENIEPAFEKNTAFNKDFGTTAGTVAEGNDPRILAGAAAEQNAKDYADQTFEPALGYTPAKESEVVKEVLDAEGNSVVDEFGVAQLPEVVQGVSDASLYLDPTTKELRANVSIYPQTLTKAVGGTQVFTLDFEPTNFLSVNGRVPLFDDEWVFTPPTTLEIIPEMADGERVKVVYERFITQP